MKRIKVKGKYINPYANDCDRIITAFKDNGYSITTDQAIELWTEYSDMYAAGWLGLPENNAEIFSCLKSFFEEDNEET